MSLVNVIQVGCSVGARSPGNPRSPDDWGSPIPNIRPRGPVGDYKSIENCLLTDNKSMKMP